MRKNEKEEHEDEEENEKELLCVMAYDVFNAFN